MDLQAKETTLQDRTAVMLNGFGDLFSGNDCVAQRDNQAFEALETGDCIPGIIVVYLAIFIFLGLAWWSSG